MAQFEGVQRSAVVRRGQWLTWLTLAYNSLEGILSVAAGAIAGSVALVGFGLDSFIEVTASAAAIWRLREDADTARRERAERQALRVIAVTFFALSAYIAMDSLHDLVTQAAPRSSKLGIAIAAASLVVMPLLASAKRRVASRLRSDALRAEARQTDICMYLSALLLLGLTLNAALGWWWADPASALLMTPLIAREGLETWRGRPPCCDDCATP